MRLASVNVSAGRTVAWRGRAIETGIFKEPAAGRVLAGRLGLAGDRQCDPSVHGGEWKAVYAYAKEHYDAWERELGRALPFGAFGENLTVERLREEEVCVGDVLRAGEAVLEAVQPRLPCFKLGVRFGDPAMPKRFLESGRLGIYFRVLEPGLLGAGDEVALLRRDPARFPVLELARLAGASARDPGAVRRALAASALPPEWREVLSGGGEAEEGA